MIEISNLSKRYGALTAVDDISFNVQAGEVLGFLGPNGAGKSTTMKMITGFLAPTSGSVRVCGHDVQTEPLAAKACMGYLPEGAPSYGEMTVRAFLEFIADVRGLSGERRRARLDDVIARLGLASVLEQVIETLSKGFKRRVGLAQALLHDPQVLILDEPTDGLDPNQKHEVRELISAMSKDKIIVISTHILEEVDAVCNRAIIIAAGRILADDTPKALARARAERPARRRLPPDHAGREAGRAGGRQCVTSLHHLPARVRQLLRHAARARVHRDLPGARQLFTFFLGGFYERGQADLAPFFNYQPWLYLFLMPAMSMRLWAEERKSGTIELLMTLPVTPWQAVIGKFLAAWAVAGVALALTFPIWITVNYLGDPDNGAILAAYIGSLADGRRIARDRRVLLGGDAQPGDRVHPERHGLLPVPAVGFRDGAERVPGLGAAAGDRRDRLAVVPDALRLDRQGRDRRSRPAVLRHGDRCLADGHRDRARPEEGGLR